MPTAGRYTWPTGAGEQVGVRRSSRPPTCLLFGAQQRLVDRRFPLLGTPQVV
jgi:hypothetical protein